MTPEPYLDELPYCVFCHDQVPDPAGHGPGVCVEQNGQQEPAAVTLARMQGAYVPSDQERRPESHGEAVSEKTRGKGPRKSDRFEMFDVRPVVVEEPTADEILDELDPDVLQPLDFPQLLAEGIPETDWLEHPYIARGARHWVFGPAESAKSLWFQWLAAKLTRSRRNVAFFSAENPLKTDLDRMSRLKPEYQCLRYYHMPKIDLNDPGDFLKVAEAIGDTELVIFDTLSALWSGDENSNKEIVALDSQVLVPLVRMTGAALVVIHHTGHPQAFVSRGGANAGRGGSAMGQKADVVMVFQAVGPHEFTIDHGKNRTPGGLKAPKARFQVVDTEDEGLDIIPMGRHIDERVLEAMEQAVEMVLGTGGMGTNMLKTALGETGFGKGTAERALEELRKDDPPRIRPVDGMVQSSDGKRRKGRLWVPADQVTPSDPELTQWVG